MATPSTALLVLLLCGALAAAARDHLDLKATEAALALRASAWANASTGVRAGDAELDAAFLRKSQGSACTCFLQEAKWTRLEADYRVEFAALDRVERTPEEDCTGQCSHLCHNKAGHKFGPSQVKTLGAELDVSSPIVAATCSAEGECSCLDANLALKRMARYSREYRESTERSNKRSKKKESLSPPLKTGDILKTKQIYDTSAQCLQQCACWDGYQGLCTDQWDWADFLSQDEGCKGNTEGVVLKSCSFTQQFLLRKDGKSAYKVELESLGGRVPELDYDLRLNALQFEAEGMLPYRTTRVKVGYKVGHEVIWKVSKSSAMQKTWSWSVKDPRGKVRFTISEAEAEVGGEEGPEVIWEVHEKKGERLYIVEKQSNTISANEGFEWLFRVRPIEKPVAKLKYSKEKWVVKVLQGEDAGLITMASVLIAKACAHKQC